jgi:hypothetical protein
MNIALLEVRHCEDWSRRESEFMANWSVVIGTGILPGQGIANSFVDQYIGKCLRDKGNCIMALNSCSADSQIANVTLQLFH